MPTLDKLKQALKGRGGFEAVEAKATDTQIRLEGRVPPNSSSHWVLIVGALLNASGKGAWSLDYSKHYFLRQLTSGVKLFYAHRLIFQATNIEASIPEILQVVASAPHPSRVELQEFPLSGVGAHRQAKAGRGAYNVDRAPLGPQAARGR